MTESIVNYDADEAGKILHRTANWMKTQARAGKIPVTRLGRKMVWTPQQISEILRAGEQKPQAVLAARPPARRRASADGPAVLQARPQQRKRGAA